jgi:hypothetical protein
MNTETKTVVAATFCMAFTTIGAVAFGDGHESKQLESHEHGVAELNMALDDELLYVELDAPAMNFVGFEHPPRTAEQKQAVNDAIEALEKPASIFSVSAAANCRLVEAQAKHLLDADEDNGADHEDAAHDDDDGHSEFVARYQLRCARPERLQTLKAELFGSFPLTTEVEASFIGPDVQTFGELTPANPELSLEP